MTSVLRTNLGLLVLANFLPFSTKKHTTITTSAKFCTRPRAYLNFAYAKLLEIYFSI